MDLSKDEIKRILQESGLPTYLEMSDSERWWGEASTSGLYFHIIVASQTPQEDAKAVDAEIEALRSDIAKAISNHSADLSATDECCGAPVDRSSKP